MNTLKILTTILILAFSAFAADISISNMTTGSGAFVLPIEGVEMQGVIAFQMNITFDPNIVQATGNFDSDYGCSTVGTVAYQLTPTCNLIGNTLHVAVWGNPIEDDGTILNITFKARNPGKSVMAFSSGYVFDEYGLVDSTFTDGTVRVSY